MRVLIGCRHRYRLQRGPQRLKPFDYALRDVVACVRRSALVACSWSKPLGTQPCASRLIDVQWVFHTSLYASVSGSANTRTEQAGQRHRAARTATRMATSRTRRICTRRMSYLGTNALSGSSRATGLSSPHSSSMLSRVLSAHSAILARWRKAPMRTSILRDARQEVR